MFVRDIEGNVLQITDLEEAIKQADLYRKYKHLDNALNENNQAQAYWQDLYEKLSQLKENGYHKDGSLN